jgi:hypothetical protein
VIPKRRGKGVAAIVSVHDLALLKALENREDLRAVKKALAELKHRGNKPTPRAEVKK